MTKDKQWLKEEIKKRRLVSSATLFGLIDQLEEPETLSQEWISKHLTDGHNVDAGDAVVFVYDLEKVAVPKQDKPIIPKDVAKLVEYQKATINDTGRAKLSIMLSEVKDLPFDMLKAQDWMVNNYITFCTAVANGYEVEKEKRYQLRSINKTIDKEEAYLNFYDYEKKFFISTGENDSDFKTIFSEEELKDIDETGFERVEVTE